jgi:hypothetical protein
MVQQVQISHSILLVKVLLLDELDELVLLVQVVHDEQQVQEQILQNLLLGHINLRIICMI